MKIKEILKILCIFAGLDHQIHSSGPLVDISSNSSCNVSHLSHYYAKMNGDLKDYKDTIKSVANKDTIKSVVNSSFVDNNMNNFFTVSNSSKKSDKKLKIDVDPLKKINTKKPTTINKYASVFVALPVMAAGVYEYMKHDDSKKDLHEKLNDHHVIHNQSWVRRILDNKYSPYVGIGVSVALVYGAYLYYTNDETQVN